jgi:hypothetical protein
MDDIACCCPSRPMARVIMPPTAERAYPVELLLCGHHFRVSQRTLAAAGAVAQNMRGDFADQAPGLALL